MDRVAAGRFEVTVTPQPGEGPIGRFTLAKVFHGDLQGVGAGEMTAFRSPVPGSAGYVAIETVTGEIEGRAGSFVLQHFGLMDRSVPEQRVVIIPDSGTGALEGVTGQMTIDSSNHAYVLTYRLPGS